MNLWKKLTLLWLTEHPVSDILLQVLEQCHLSCPTLVYGTKDVAIHIKMVLIQDPRGEKSATLKHASTSFAC